MFIPPKNEIFSMNISTPITRAREIMGEDRFYGTDAIESVFGSVEEEKVPSSFLNIREEELSSLENYWRLIWVPRFSIEEMVSLLNGRCFFHSEESRYHLSFAKKKGDVNKWALVSTEPKIGSVGISMPDQIKLLEKNENVSTAREIILLWIIERETREKNLFIENMVRTHDRVGEYQIVVGSDGHEINIGGAFPHIRYSNIGLAVTKSMF